ncbi:DUF6531 domain-containing protein [Sorangium sp. So ce1151]|uniref:DUF6531 domain-containing protein n=1 Tax=Sorangium sp. So ce1151 TaxID=3133332 RepID=UPI003F5D5D16
MAHNFHDINGWLIVGIEGHNGFHIFPPMPMWFWKLTLLHPFTLGDRQQPTVLFNGVPSVTHQHEPTFLWPHLGIIPDPLDALTPLHILFGSHKCWLPRGAVEICGEKATCCVIGGPVSLNADCWEYGKWPTSLVLNPGTVQTTPTFGDFAMGARTLAVDLVIDLAFEFAMKLGGPFVKKLGGKIAAPFRKKGDDLLGDGLRAATKNSDEAAGEAAERGAKNAAEKGASDVPTSRCTKPGHPVDATSGRVVDEKVDLSLPGVIPIVWQRTYSSGRALDRAALGRGGWAHSFEQWVERRERNITLRDQEGRAVYFKPVSPGESVFHRMDRLTLTSLPDGAFTVYSHVTRLTRRFAPAEPGGRALLRAIEDAHGNAITLDYAGARLTRVVDTAGREVRVRSTHGGRIARIEVWVGDHLEQWVDYAYSKMGDLASATDALGYAEHYAYDEDHRMVKTTLKNGVSFYYDYDPETGWCRKTWGDGGLYAVELRADLERRITWVTGNDEPRILYWNEDRLVVREETPDGILIKTCEFDEDQYLIAEANGAGETARFEHDARGNKTLYVDPAGNETRWDYEDDQPVLCVNPGGSATHYRYGERGELVGVAAPSGLRHELHHDRRGRLREVRREGRTMFTLSYDAHHNVAGEVDVLGATTSYTYDALGRPTGRTDALGRSAQIEYDRLGRPLAVWRPDGTVARSAFDALGRRARTTDALGNVTEMEYAGTGVLTRLKQPGGATWVFRYTPDEKLRRIINPRGEQYELTYDTAGRVVRETTFDGRTIDYRYSAAGRLGGITYPDGSYRAFTHSPLGKVLREESTDGLLSFQRDRQGRLLGAVVEQDGREVVTRFERDELGRMVAEHQGDRTVRYEYDTFGRRTRRVMPDGSTTRYTYDELNRLIGLEHDGRGFVIQRDALGRERARGDAGGRFSIQSEYDSMDRVIEQRVAVPAPAGAGPAEAVRRFWQYEQLGRVKRVEDGRWGTTSYTHDALGQLTEVSRGDHRTVFEYDAAGALLGALDQLGGAPPDAPGAPWDIGQGNRLRRTEDAEYTYDQRGRRVRKRELAEGAGATEYSWDARDRLREVKLPSGSRVHFTYDAFGRRLRKEVASDEQESPHAVDFVWDGDSLAADIDARHGARCFVHEPGTLTPLLQAERGEVFSYVNDHVGVPRELVDSAGTVAWSARHSTWGHVAETQQDAGRAGESGRGVESPFRLLGQYADDETGLAATRFRYFDPEVGRWCSPDPLGIDGGADLFGFNGSPAVDVDPLGLQIDYFPLDSLGRPTGVFSEITASQLRPTNSSPPSRARRDAPPGWVGGQHPHHQQRSHLLADTLGGSGRVRENIVALTDGSNSPGMRNLEDRVRAHVRNGNTVLYEVRVNYQGNDLLPDSVSVYAIDQNGTVIVDDTVPNGLRQQTACCTP